MPLTVEVQIVTQEPKILVSEIDRVKQQLIEYTEKINKGEMSFETIARIYSEDGDTALRGGEMGFVSRAEARTRVCQRRLWTTRYREGISYCQDCPWLPYHAADREA